jgi:hypothetical protein
MLTVVSLLPKHESGITWLISSSKPYTPVNAQGSVAFQVALYRFLLALTSASSVGAWTLWQQHRNIWAVIIGVGQVLLIALPHFPFLKSEKEFLAMSFDFEGLYLRYEQLWYDFRDGTIDESVAKTRINDLRAREVEIEKAGVRCPRIQRWMDRVATDAKSVLKLDLV